ncbi:MAG TPA: tetratricopeptide repeat protein [Bryobacteraceae bacterium]|jgi:tetratricopeptide (TPR) repeat protein|nr:tetratricopeptide repeat protein [Bryobacteraceae bacterium]
MRLLLLAMAVIPLLAQTPHIRAAQEYFAEGTSALSKDQPDAAIKSFEKAIEIEPTFFEARELLIRTYRALGKSLQEGAAITEYLEIKPESTEYRIRLGQILLAEKQPQKALAQYSLVLRREPDNPDGLLGFASAASAAGMQDRAAQALARGRQKYPSDARFRSAQP